MRVFQISTVYPQAAKALLRQFNGFSGLTFTEIMRRTIRDGFDGSHILAPAFSDDPSFCIVWGNLPASQGQWAKERGWTGRDPMAIVCAQIEEHRSEVVYSLDPLLFPSNFVRRLPGTVKRAVAWRAAAPGDHDFSAYHGILSNFPTLNQVWEQRGMKSFFFSPSIDPTADEIPDPVVRDIDICFIGSVLSCHRQRIAHLQQILDLQDRFNIRVHLNRTMVSRLASLPLVSHLPGNRWHLPRTLTRSALPPLFGKDMFALMKRSKLVLNISANLGRPYRGNMRCFEAMSCGCAMVADAGVYPDGMVPGVNMEVFEESEDLRPRVLGLLNNPSRCRAMGKGARDLMTSRYSKMRQWEDFQQLIASL